jgi:hypothetical protein
MRTVLVASCVLALASPAWGATITLDRTGDKPVIHIVGGIDEGDGEAFKKIIDQIPRSAMDTVVVLESPGGRLGAGMVIAAGIVLNKFNTFVRGGTECVSVCALIWLSGSKRYVEAKSRIGFHCVFTKNADGEPQIDSSGNAEIGAWYSGLGLDLDAIDYLTSSPPKEITWLTAESAKKHNIAVELIDGGSAPVVAQDDEPPITQANPAVVVHPIAPKDNGIKVFTLVCVPINDPSTRIHVTASFNIANNWHMEKWDVVHENGGDPTPHNRKDQYMNFTWVRGEGYSWTWGGVRISNAGEFMQGHLYWRQAQNGDHARWVYEERHYLGDAQNWAMESICS